MNRISPFKPFNWICNPIALSMRICNPLICLLLFSTLCLAPASAQRRKAKAAVPEKTPEETLYDELLPSTAKVMFIDSVVVDKETFLSSLNIPKDLGTLTSDGDGVSYTNEFADTRISSSADTISGRRMFLSHRYGSTWEEPRELTEITGDDADYPFLMADGVTLFFSASGTGTVGGRDIFRTTYNADDLEFYSATNIGLPYNSPANEYLLAISDFDNLGWLVTDRNQPDGWVCIYTFEPTAQRETFDEDTDKKEIKAYASLNSIADSWTFGDRDAALQRKTAAEARMNQAGQTESIYFVVDDNTIYTSISDFPSNATKVQYISIDDDKQKLQMLQKLLDSTRENYSTASRQKRYEIGRQIAELETETEQLSADIAEAEKKLRNKILSTKR